MERRVKAANGAGARIAMRSVAALAAAVLGACIPDWEKVEITFRPGVEQPDVASFLGGQGFEAEPPRPAPVPKALPGRQANEPTQVLWFHHREIPTIRCWYLSIPKPQDWTMTCDHEELAFKPGKHSADMPPEKQALMRARVAELRRHYGERIARIRAGTK
jgi:hypothetical protein